MNLYTVEIMFSDLTEEKQNELTSIFGGIVPYVDPIPIAMIDIDKRNEDN